MQILVIYQLGFDEECYTFTLILLIKIFLRSEFLWTQFINLKCFEMRSRWPMPKSITHV